MAKKTLLCTLENLTPIPPGSIWRDPSGAIDFETEKDPVGIKEKLSEYDDKQKLVFKKAGLKIDNRIEKASKDPKAKVTK